MNDKLATLDRIPQELLARAVPVIGEHVCGNCKHFYPLQAQQQQSGGECRESSPQVTFMSVPQQQEDGHIELGIGKWSGWPTTQADKSCGKWSMRA